MGRMAIAATVARIEERPHSLLGLQHEVFLCDVLGDGLPLPDGTRADLTGPLRALDLMPGDRIALAATLGACGPDGRVVGPDLDDPVQSLRSLQRDARMGMYSRLRHPRGVRRVRAS